MFFRTGAFISISLTKFYAFGDFSMWVGADIESRS
jgi:hypothetical protein